MSTAAAATRFSIRPSTPRTVSNEFRSHGQPRQTPQTGITPVDAVPAVRPWPVRDETITFHNVVLESGALVNEISVHYRLEGALSAARDNLVLVVHALTGTAHASEWWKGVIEADGAIDPTRHAVLCANLLGGCNGTTGPSNEHPDRLPSFTTRDQAAVLALLLDALAVQQPLLVCGGSLGGMVALEFAASFPERIRSAVVLAAPAAQTAQGIVWGAIMQRAIAVGGVEDGLALARMVGMLSYRTPEGLERRFGRARNANGDFLVREWLSTHGEKLVQRFDATSYTALLAAMDAHDVGRGRGGITAALAPLADRLTGVGIPGELLYPAETVREWTTAAHASYVDLPSVHGHDGFLLETIRVGAILRAAIQRAESTYRTGASLDAPADSLKATP
jgi:homoserine O-acetyltransferase